jgi:hypothetical protein
MAAPGRRRAIGTRAEPDWAVIHRELVRWLSVTMRQSHAGASLWESVGDHKAISKVSSKTALSPSWPHKLFQTQAGSDQSSVLSTRPLGGFERRPLRRAWRLRIAAVAS